MRALLTIISIILLASCHKKETAIPVEYNGPLREAVDVDVLYTEKDRVKVKMQAKKILEYKNGDREFPEGIYLEFFDEFGVMTSTLKANDAFYFKEENKWRGRGKVEVKNIQKQQQLNTEELFWFPVTKKISSEKFVTIKLETEIIYGTGLDAAQDLSYYTIKKPEGVFDVKD
ncbi:MAG: LPS export ABC transporter periplasmic protein LptC [Cyclobacteriaceae bacterium]|nr:LPS export ABC transporter periplasmic protein LptC [Cyclobacteriaceae bacterium]